jgi:glycerol-1-phosphatase
VPIPDLVAPREIGLTLEPGFFAHVIADATGVTPVFFGKPYSDAYEDVLARLPGIPRERIAMVGDTLHTDVLGGRAAGVGTLLLLDHGLFAGQDIDAYVARSGIVPDDICAST